MLAFFLGYVIHLSSFTDLILLVVLTGASVYVSGIAEKALGNKDDHRIVIDEIMGYFWAIALLPALTLPVRIIAFILFRFFDVFKIPSRRVQNLQGGWGVMMDDVFSGIAVNVLLQAAFKIPWVNSHFF